MKKSNFIFLVLLSFFFASSCTEWGETLVFEIVNCTNKEILFIKEGGIYDSDTTKLKVNERITDISSEGSGNASPYPFANCKTIILIYQDTIKNIYSKSSVGKNPLNLEYYEEISRTETRYKTSAKYEYLIMPEDFEN